MLEVTDKCLFGLLITIGRKYLYFYVGVEILGWLSEHDAPAIGERNLIRAFYRSDSS